MSQIPKPAFVIADVHSGSYTTAMDVTTAGQISASLRGSSLTTKDDEEDEPVLLCGTNDGAISLWSLATFRPLHRFSLEELAILLEFPKEPEPGDPVRITSVHARHCRLLVQFKSNELHLLDLQSSLRHPVSLLDRPWSTFSTTFAQVFPLFDHCYAFLAAEPPFTSGAPQADVIQLVNSKRCLPFAKVKLLLAEKEEDKGHGIVMALHLFTKDIPAAAEDEEKQALYLLLAYEDGFIALYRTALREHLQTTFEATKQAKRFSEQPLFEAVQISALQSHSEMVTCIAFHEGTMRGIACSVDNEIAIWDVKTAEDRIASEEKGCDNGGGEATKKDKPLGLVERRSRRIKLTNAGILCAAIRADGRIFATGGKDGRLRLFGLRTGKPLAILAYHSNTIEAVRFGNTLLFAASRDKSISVWSLYNNNSND